MAGLITEQMSEASRKITSLQANLEIEREAVKRATEAKNAAEQRMATTQRELAEEKAGRAYSEIELLGVQQSLVLEKNQAVKHTAELKALLSEREARITALSDRLSVLEGRGDTQGDAFAMKRLEDRCEALSTTKLELTDKLTKANHANGQQKNRIIELIDELNKTRAQIADQSQQRFAAEQAEKDATVRLLAQTQFDQAYISHLIAFISEFRAKTDCYFTAGLPAQATPIA